MGRVDSNVKTVGNNWLVGWGCDGGGSLTRVQEVRFVSYLKKC